MIFIASTGQADQPRRAELEKLGVTNFLGKPYSAHLLLMTLRDALQGRRLARDSFSGKSTE